MAALKIAQVNLEPDYGGAERHVQMLAHGLQTQGHDVTLICHPNGRLRQEAERARIRTLTLHTGSQLAPSAPLRLASQLRRERPDVLHLHTSKDYLCGAIAGRLANVPVVVLTRHMLLPLKPLMRCVYARVDAVVCLTQGLAALLQSQQLPADKLHLMYGAIDLAPFTTPISAESVRQTRQDWNACPEEVLMGCIGRLVEGKGQDVLLEAAARCRARRLPLRLILVGSGPQKTALQMLARQLGLSAYVHFADFQEDIPRILAALDIVAVPSTVEELLPLVILEALAARRPVVASQVGGVSEIIADNSVGLLVPPGNVEALANALCCLASDADLRQKLGNSGANRVQTCFALPRLLQDTQNLYSQLLQNTRN